MGIAERRERERAERKTLIINCAKALILEYGAEKVSMMDISKKAELSKATLYLYFPSKDLLFKEICTAAGIKFVEFFQSRMKPGLTLLETLKLYWDCFLELYGESNDMIIIFSMKEYLTPDYPFLFLEERSDSSITFEFYTTLRDMIAQGINEGLFAPETNPAMISRVLLSLFSGIIENAAKMPESVRNAQAIINELTNLFQIILRGIAREGLDRSCLTLPNPFASLSAVPEYRRAPE
jgi:AcrR family transcriptional regulator